MRRYLVAFVLVNIMLGFGAPNSSAAALFDRTIVARERITGEPSVAIDDRTNPPTIYVAEVATPAQLWRSTDGAITFQRVARTKGGGGDNSVVVDAAGTVYVSELVDSDQTNSILISVSTSGGALFARKTRVGQGADITNDRPWMASARAGHLVVTAHDSKTSQIVSWVSTNSARSFSGPYAVDLSPAISSAPPGPLVAGPKGVYSFALRGPAGIRFAKSSNGANWTTSTVADGHFPSGFAVLAADAASNLYVVWSEAVPATNMGTGPVYLARSTNGGRSWSPPTAVSPATPDAFGRTPTAVFPWVVAGAKGRVDIAYVVAHAQNGPNLPSDLGGPQTTWDLVVAQSLNATAVKPSWTHTVVAPGFHTGSICSLHALCANQWILNLPTPFDGRDLRFFGMTSDRSGRAYVAYINDRRFAGASPADVVAQVDIMLGYQWGGTRLR